jgi:hypothetical protein
MSCAHHASPTATLTWRHAGVVVEDRGRMRRSKNGSLVIDEVLSTDAGDYVCTTINLLGSDSITVNLIVKGENQEHFISLDHQCNYSRLLF